MHPAVAVTVRALLEVLPRVPVARVLVFADLPTPRRLAASTIQRFVRGWSARRRELSCLVTYSRRGEGIHFEGVHYRSHCAVQRTLRVLDAVKRTRVARALGKRCVVHAVTRPSPRSAGTGTYFVSYEQHRA